MKIAPIMAAMRRIPDRFEQTLVHTGQHYDENMSRVFFEELGLPRPDLNLGVGSGTHGWQTAQVMLGFEPVVTEINPDWIVVVGDVNSTLACALVAGKLGVPVAHVEAGLRSFDRTMPEEINRLLTDQLSEMLFTPSRGAGLNLLREGIRKEKIHFVGNVMIDTLVRLRPSAESRWPDLRRRFDLDSYVLVTLHRPRNVDRPQTLAAILAALADVSREVQVLFPAHPRTRESMLRYGLTPAGTGVRLIEPLGYLDFLALQIHAALVLTDSGGIQEETTYLGVPCLTVRPNTERPVTVEQGTNELVGSGREELVEKIRIRLQEKGGESNPPDGWDGNAAERIVAVMAAN
jgi:UDP-N-acetylglucosamine 2-epimerase (non-hydrolysing)